MGSWEILIAFMLIGCNSLLKRQKPEILGVLTALIVGIGIDMWLFLMHHFITPELWYSKSICFAIGLVVVAAGTAIYLHTNIAPIPVDRLTLIIQEITRTNLFFSRTLVYLVFLLMALLFNGPIDVGTVVTVCLGGLLLNFFMPITGKALDGILTDSRSRQNIDKKHSL